MKGFRIFFSQTWSLFCWFFFFFTKPKLVLWTIRAEIAYLNHLVCFPSSSSIFQQCNWSSFSIWGRGWWLELDPVVKRGNIDYLLLSRWFYGFASVLYSSKQIYFPVFIILWWMLDIFYSFRTFFPSSLHLSYCIC